MSRVTEMAAMEAAEAEAADPDEDAEVEDAEQAERDAEREREADQIEEADRELPSDAVMEQIGRQLDREGDRHFKAVAKIMGDQFGDLVPCPLCITPGFVTVEPVRDFDPMQRQAVLLTMGEFAPPELKDHPILYRCPTCDGWGELITGARKETTRTDGCPDCNGYGYRNRDQEQALATVTQLPTQAGGPPIVYPPASPAPGTAAGQVTQGGYTFAIVSGGAPDPHGRLAGHPLWGQDASVGGL